MLRDSSKTFLRDATAAAAGVFLADVVRELARDAHVRAALEKAAGIVQGALRGEGKKS